MSLPPHLDHLPIGGGLLGAQEVPDLQSLNFGVHVVWRKPIDRDVWHQCGNAPPLRSLPVKKKRMNTLKTSNYFIKVSIVQISKHM